MRTVEEVLGVAARSNLDNVLVISQRPEGGIVFLSTAEMTLAEANWLLDQAKHLLLLPDYFEKRDGGGTAA